MDVRDALQNALGPAYFVAEEVGRGGMSRVFLAHDQRLNRRIVVKVLRPDVAGDLSVERFKREIQIAASLQHPHIVPLHSAGAVEGMPYYTMPFVEGRTLRDLLQASGQLGVAQAFGILRDIARALAHAHRKGVVHRDVKPENVLLSEGVALVTDFGIAKAFSASRAPGDRDSLTLAGSAVGTPAYMAPEQMAADPGVDHRADIFALGVIAYEMLAGRHPFEGRTPRERAAAQMSEVPQPLSELRPGVSAELSELVMRCLDKDPDLRPQSADLVSQAIEDALSRTGEMSLEEERARVKRALGIYVLAFVGVIAIAWLLTAAVGLPEWALSGTTVLMSLGLPAVMLTAAARISAIRRTSSRDLPQSLGKSWLVRFGRFVSWQYASLGGALAIAAFAAFVAGFMLLRAHGIGPAGSLLAAGTIRAHEHVLMTDFGSVARDTTIARLAAGALRVALDQSNIVRVLSPDSTLASLRRTRREPTDRITLSIAREIGRREGMRTIIDGDLIPDAEGWLLTARLVSTESGSILASASAGAAVPGELLDAADDVGRALRAKIGESLRSVRRSPALPRVTTSSMEALEKYTAASRAYDFDADLPTAIALLNEAVSIDTAFAMAWRRLHFAYGYQGERARSIDARERAFRHRDRLPASERLAIEALQYSATGDRVRAMVALEGAVQRGDSSLINNMAQHLIFRREFARAESLTRAAIRIRDDRIAHGNLAEILVNQGKFREADSAALAAQRRFPRVRVLADLRATALCAGSDDAGCDRLLDSLRKVEPRPGTLAALGERAWRRGQASKAMTLDDEAERLGTAQNRPGLSGAAMVFWRADIDIWVFHRPDRALSRLDRLRGLTKPDELAKLAERYAFAGRPDRARDILTTRLRGLPDSAIRQIERMHVRQAWAALALAEGRWADAIRDYRAADVAVDGYPVNNCTMCLPLKLAIAFDRGNMPDSAALMYELWIKTPFYYRPGWEAIFLAHSYERLADLHERLGNPDRAAEYVQRFLELWSHADPVFEPRLSAARTRLARLKPPGLDIRKPFRG